jgi:large subunit ribosomal protein L31
VKKDIHPQYREVLFLDAAVNFGLVTRSTVKTSEKMMWEGKEYPVIRLDISSASHPFFTGKMKFVDATGRVDRFNKKYGNYKKPGKGETPAS